MIDRCTLPQENTPRLKGERGSKLIGTIYANHPVTLEPFPAGAVSFSTSIWNSRMTLSHSSQSRAGVSVVLSWVINALLMPMGELKDSPVGRILAGTGSTIGGLSRVTGAKILVSGKMFCNASHGPLLRVMFPGSLDIEICLD